MDAEARLDNYLREHAKYTDSPEGRLEAALAKRSTDAAPPAPAPEKPGMMDILRGSLKKRGEEIAAAPGRLVEMAKDPSKWSARNLIPEPKPSTVLPLAIPGGGTVTARLGAMAAGAMMDDPKPTAGENLTTAAKGATVPAIIETAMGAGGKILQSLPGAKAKIARKDAARFGEATEELTEGMLSGRTAADLGTMGAGGGKRTMNAVKDDVVKRIEARVGDLHVPSLGNTPMSLSAANKELRKVSLGPEFKLAGTDQTIRGAPDREKYGKIAQEIKEAIDVADPSGGARKAWEEVQGAYSRGATVLDLLRKPGVFDKKGSEAFSIQKLQEMLSKAKTRERVADKLGPDNYQKLIESLRMNKPGDVDSITTRGRSMWGGAILGGLLGTGGAVAGGPVGAGAALLPLAFPNALSHYAGRAPYRVGPGTQTWLDIIGQEATR